MPFKLDIVSLVLDTFTFGCWSGYWNIQKITQYKSIDNINDEIPNFIRFKKNGYTTDCRMAKKPYKCWLCIHKTNR